jgi:hypothetical protein
MSQREHLQALDAEIFAGLADSAAGGDDAVLTYKDGTQLACGVYVDRSAERFGDQGEVIYVDAVIHFFKSEVTDEPVQGTRVVVDGDTFTTGKKEIEDVSRWVYRCKAGR